MGTNSPTDLEHSTCEAAASNVGTVRMRSSLSVCSTIIDRSFSEVPTSMQEILSNL
jgi:hypothetical protein